MRNRNYVFNDVPVLKRKRTRFPLSYRHQTTMNVGTLYPVYCQEIYPGDEFKCTPKCVLRVSSRFLRPVMDNLFCDISFFFVPSRLTYPDFPKIFGENRENAWARNTVVKVPSFTSILPGTVGRGTVGDVLYGVDDSIGAPAGLSALPMRAFAMIWNEWYRDQNTTDPVLLDNLSYIDSLTFNSQAWSPTNIVGQLPKVSKLRDYFTSALPAPQKGSAVDLPLAGTAPVITGDNMSDLQGNPAVRFIDVSTGKLSSGGALYAASGANGQGGEARLVTDAVPGGVGIAPSNLYADLNGTTAVSVNDFRMAVQLQKILERQARGGTRYTEFIQAAFGVRNADSRLQRPEYLGGYRFPIGIQQVAQTSANTETDGLGELGAFSYTYNDRGTWRKAFTEYGYVIGCACIRQKHTYQQGVERFLWRTKQLDFYDPALQTIGEQPVYKKEIYSGAGSDEIFGYQEAWADLRCRQDRVSGNMRSSSDASFDVWNFADNYANAPVLGQDFIEETPEFVDRTLAVPSTSAPQFLADWYFEQFGIRELVPYSVPSLVDHH